MAITAQQKNKIIQVVNVFETGTINGDYANVSMYFDGPFDATAGKRIKQITYGRSQTTEFGILKILLQQYISNNGLFANVFIPYMSHIGTLPSLCTDAVFVKALKDAGRQDPIMKSTQDVFFDQLYYQPAYLWFTSMKFTMALSLLVIYDSQVHSGGVPAFLREKFAEPVPKNGGDEKKWIIAYVNTRYDWLANNSRADLRATRYRMDAFKDAIAKNNWDISLPINANGTPV